MKDMETSHRRRWSWLVGHIAGIELRVHATFVLLLAWILAAHLASGHGVTAALVGLLTVAVVFGVVVLHELGHALVARHFGIRTRDITLLPIGGVARLERMPTRPREELLVALAGPAVNVGLAALSTVVAAVGGSSWSPRAVEIGGPPVSQFLWLNVGLAAFNMLPAFPTDGGRVLRALLAMRMDRVRATDIAARTGQWLALVIGLAGIFGSPMLVFVALFIWVGAAEEAAMVHLSVALERLHVVDAMVIDFDALRGDTSVGNAAKRAIHSAHRYFPVVDDSHVLGMVSSDNLVTAAKEHGRDSVASIVAPLAATTSPDDSVEVALERLREAEAAVLPVVENGALVGLFMPENVFRLAS